MNQTVKPSAAAGNSALVARIGLYALAGYLANSGIGTFDADAMTLTIDLDSLATMIGSIGSLGAALGWRHVVKKLGGKT